MDRPPLFTKGQRVQRAGTSDFATVTEDEEDGFVRVQYDHGTASNVGTVATHPMLQFATKFTAVP